MEAKYIDPPIAGQAYCVVTCAMTEGTIPRSDPLQTYGICKVRGCYPTVPLAEQRSRELLDYDKGLFTSYIVPVGTFFAQSAKKLEDGDPNVNSIDMRKAAIDEALVTEVDKYVQRTIAEEKALIADIQARADKIRVDPAGVLINDVPVGKTAEETLLNNFFALYSHEPAVNAKINELFGMTATYRAKLAEIQAALEEDPTLMDKAKEQYKLANAVGASPPDFEKFLQLQHVLLTDDSVKLLKNILVLGTLTPAQINRGTKRKGADAVAQDDAAQKKQKP